MASPSGRSPGPAARAGLAEGDILLAISGKAVNSVEDARAALAAKPKNVALLVQRGGDQIFIPVRLN